jgi:hypothetical protein
MKRVETTSRMSHSRKRGETPSGVSKVNGWLKQRVARLRRRMERRDVEDVPTRFTRGWAD